MHFNTMKYFTCAEAIHCKNLKMYKYQIIHVKLIRLSHGYVNFSLFHLTNEQIHNGMDFGDKIRDL